MTSLFPQDGACQVTCFNVSSLYRSGVALAFESRPNLKARHLAFWGGLLSCVFLLRIHVSALLPGICLNRMQALEDPHSAGFWRVARVPTIPSIKWTQPRAVGNDHFCDTKGFTEVRTNPLIPQPSFNPKGSNSLSTESGSVTELDSTPGWDSAFTFERCCSLTSVKRFAWLRRVCAIAGEIS